MSIYREDNLLELQNDTSMAYFIIAIYYKDKKIFEAGIEDGKYFQTHGFDLLETIASVVDEPHLLEMVIEGNAFLMTQVLNDTQSPLKELTDRLSGILNTFQGCKPVTQIIPSITVSKHRPIKAPF